MSYSIAIIGGGLSGTSVAIQLVRQAQQQGIPTPTIYMIEQRQERVGRGIAYSGTLPYQPLNVIAAKMSLFDDEPLHFLQWAQAHQADYAPQLDGVEATSFVSRRIYGDYVVETLQNTIAASNGALQVIENEVIAIEPLYAGYHALHLQDGGILYVQQVVLALGNAEPAPLAHTNPRVFNNPWDASLLEQLQPTDDILILGTGLTMVDWTASLHQRGHKGTITALSRRGFLPLPHNLTSPAYQLTDAPHFDTPLEFVKKFQAQIAEAQTKGIAWQAVLDAYRSHLPAIWKNFDDNNRRIFLRFLRPYWEVHRHRMPTQSHHILTTMQQTGNLRVTAGRVLNWTYEADSVTLLYKSRTSQQLETIKAQYVINCTGSNTNLQQSQIPIINSLLAQQLATLDAHGLGFLTGEHGNLINANQQEQPTLHTIGSMRKATEWETTALHEIRHQAADLAQLLIKQRQQPLAGGAGSAIC